MKYFLIAIVILAVAFFIDLWMGWRERKNLKSKLRIGPGGAVLGKNKGDI